MNAIPTPPKKRLVTQKSTGKSVLIDPTEKKPKKEFKRSEHLTHRPFMDSPVLAKVKDLLEFAPKGEEHKK